MKSDRRFKIALSLVLAIALVALLRQPRQKSDSAPAPAETPAGLSAGGGIAAASGAPNAVTGASGGSGISCLTGGKNVSGNSKSVSEASAKAEISPPQTTYSVVDVAPRLETIRAEVAKNPHITPRSLLVFGAEIGQKMDDANTPEKVAALFTELSDCVQSPKLKKTITNQAICLSSAKKLSEIHPELAERMQGLNKRADPAVRRLVH